MLNLHLVFLLSIVSSGYAWRVSLTSNAPVVIGGTVQFRAEITEDNGHHASGEYQFRFRDNAIPQHSKTIDGQFTSASWEVTYNKDDYSPGTYEVQVEIYRWTFFLWNIGSKRIYFDLTALLNGGMNMTQNNKTVTEDFVSSATEVTHTIYFSEPDKSFLDKKATSVVAYWFVSCIYYGATSDLSFKYNYTNDADQTMHVEALVVASFEPLPPPTTPAPTTTIAPTDKPTSTPPTTTTAAATTTVKPSNNITALVQPNLKLGTNVSEIPILPYVCLNTSIIAPDPKKTYGYFSTKVDVKAPVSSVSWVGNNWLQHGDILNLSVSCNGSAPFLYCFQVMVGEYNVTGNETCNHETLITDCQLMLPRYIHYPGTYTVLIIISNSVSHKVTPVGVNIYEVKKHPQLSVIVVPVVCSGIAVILIIFGAAYYMQSRHRYTIEVADFDFAQANDLEYMTFGQRLKAALNNYLNRPDQYVNDPFHNINECRKYGSIQ
ncbi:uncharacterized protein LOC129000137 isoform X2 [Macrosteles quadrilineatus]|uniref:uncharacterized protein LOC128999558 isoform X2 n=1 Tax=Macrosteles quadrilineatus TaxID=74068 RepID=UPI0023E1B309|nr:uncharacterized protein LOC128999558 isoform X2 [Macrosteles quadrilineatus]XP_054283036.1 uncharacterized protein LOC129000137 isoform X2 [Macrosteles quadrilineatus]